MDSTEREESPPGFTQTAGDGIKSRIGILSWLGRTPVQTFILCPTAVLLFELALNRGMPTIVFWGLPLLSWGFLQYRFVGNYRHPRAGGSSGMDVPPDRVIDSGPYRYTRNPMYLGHLIFLTGLAVTFWSWFAILILVVRGIWFHRRVLHDEQRLHALFVDTPGEEALLSHQ